MDDQIELYILRHGDADPRESGKPDADRALTAKGRRDVRAVAKLARSAKVDPQLILTSPLRRARETADIAAAAFPEARRAVTDRLRPSSNPPSLWKQISADASATRVMVAGHEPHLSHFIKFLLGSEFSVDLKKGSLLRIDLGRAEVPHGILRWMITPKIARSVTSKT